MKSRETLLRLKRFQVDEKRRRVAQIEMMINDFERMSNELDREIKSEEARSGISDMAHFAYPTYARAARSRRDNLVQSADNLRIQLDEAKAQLAEAFEDMKKVEILEDREKAVDSAIQNQRDQATMDAIGLRIGRRA